MLRVERSYMRKLLGAITAKARRPHALRQFAGECGNTDTMVFTEFAMKHSSCDLWWISARTAALGAVPDAKAIRGCRVTRDTHNFPLAFFSMTPTASSS